MGAIGGGVFQTVKGFRNAPVVSFTDFRKLLVSLVLNILTNIALYLHMLCPLGCTTQA